MDWGKNPQPERFQSFFYWRVLGRLMVGLRYHDNVRVSCTWVSWVRFSKPISWSTRNQTHEVSSCPCSQSTLFVDSLRKQKGNICLQIVFLCFFIPLYTFVSLGAFIWIIVNTLHSMLVLTMWASLRFILTAVKHVFITILPHVLVPATPLYV